MDRSNIHLPRNPWESDEGAQKPARDSSDATSQRLLDEHVIPRPKPPERDWTVQPKVELKVEPSTGAPQGENRTQNLPAGSDSKVRLGPNNVEIVIPNLPDFWLTDKAPKPGAIEPPADTQGKPTDTQGKPADTQIIPPDQQQSQPNDQNKPSNRQPESAPNTTPFRPFDDPSFKPLKPSDVWWNKPPQRLPDVLKPTDNSFAPGPRVQAAERVVEFRNMRFRSADHGNLPDALIRLPKNFDPSQPINLVVYNHGYRDTIQSALVNAELGRQMDQAPPNTVLVLPEWQKYAGASNAIDGDFGNQNHFRNMLQEIFDKTPELKGKSLNDVKNLDIISHSGGDKAVVSQVNNNGLSGKITSITLLDSTYVIGNQLDMWLKLNIHDLASGRKQFRSIYNDTSSQSRAQADRLRKFLTQSGLPAGRVYQDDRTRQSPMTPDEIARNPIVYKYTDATYNGKGPHTSLPMLYIGPIQAANKNTRK